MLTTGWIRFVCLSWAQNSSLTLSPLAFPLSISGFEPPEEIASIAAETAAWADYYRNFLPPNEAAAVIEPMGDLIYPIVLSNIDQVQAIGVVNETYTPSNETAVGLIVASLYWRDTIRGR